MPGSTSSSPLYTRPQISAARTLLTSRELERVTPLVLGPWRLQTLQTVVSPILGPADLPLKIGRHSLGGAQVKGVT